jgi:hypothetical protein
MYLQAALMLNVRFIQIVNAAREILHLKLLFVTMSRYISKNYVSRKVKTK